ncbi:MAG: FRG domain-containing protein [Terracidiphilus sp.]
MWWRGHADANWMLKPGAFRGHHSGGADRGSALIANFKMRATGRLGHRHVPSSEIEWLFLAQHYGLPTQLLDWTENTLIALFFAVYDATHPEADASLWALSPGKLNAEHADPANPGTAQRGLIDTDERPIQAVVMQGTGFKDEAIRIRLFPNESELPALPKVVALASTEMDERIVAQSGRFTLHSCDCAIEGLDGNEKYLHKFFIPADEKPKFRWLLDSMGIRRWNLFPDLESLASELNKNEFVPIKSIPA